MPSDSSEYLAGGLDIGGPQGGRRRGEKPPRIDYEDPPQGPPVQSSRCVTCGARVENTRGACSWPALAAGRCPAMVRVGRW